MWMSHTDVETIVYGYRLVTPLPIRVRQPPICQGSILIYLGKSPETYTHIAGVYHGDKHQEEEKKT